MKCCLFFLLRKCRPTSDSSIYTVTNYATDSTEEYRRLQLVAETQPTYGVVQGEGGGNGARPWMRGLNLSSGQKGGGEGERIVGGERVVGNPAPKLSRVA